MIIMRDKTDIQIGSEWYGIGLDLYYYRPPYNNIMYGYIEKVPTH